METANGMGTEKKNFKLWTQGTLMVLAYFYKRVI